jgi:hypothetical protein
MPNTASEIKCKWHADKVYLTMRIVAATVIFDKDTMPDRPAFRINIKKARFFLGLSLY